ncbi:hypothetical protein ACQF36_12100 [Streptomyces sp. Marseille-Q5077]|uniref:hypothetical protein n=1 Tax=Streptomyces sp. Marseille-Q5077 TaxID=3418995 RepID=UPI003CFCB490
MRVLLKANLDTEKGNQAIRAGKLPQVIQELMEKIKPEAAYFTTEQGMRTMFLFFDLEDPSQMPVIADPLFFELGAKVDYTPVMNAEDVQKGLAQLKIS